nr:heat shock cognate 70 kDa protein-like [Tanacetum cinerariifolium]
MRIEEYSPKEISRIILNNLKESAEAFLATEVVDAVITVLAYFSDKQRHTIKDAGTLAALNRECQITGDTKGVVFGEDLLRKDGLKWVGLEFEMGQFRS